MQFLLGLVDKFCQTNSTTSDNPYPEEVAQALGSSLIKDKATHIAEECPLCLDTLLIENACIANRGHFFCKDWLLRRPSLSWLYVQGQKRKDHFPLQSGEGQLFFFVLT